MNEKKYDMNRAFEPVLNRQEHTSTVETPSYEKKGHDYKYGQAAPMTPNYDKLKEERRIGENYRGGA